MAGYGSLSPGHSTCNRARLARPVRPMRKLVFRGRLFLRGTAGDSAGRTRSCSSPKETTCSWEMSFVEAGWQRSIASSSLSHRSRKPFPFQFECGHSKRRGFDQELGSRAPLDIEDRAPPTAGTDEPLPPARIAQSERAAPDRPLGHGDVAARAFCR